MKQHFRAHETTVCDLLDLSPTVASGSQWHDLGDGVERNSYSHWPIMMDAKCTVQKSYSIQRGWFKQQVDRATIAGKRFILPLRFVDENSQHDDYVVMPLDDYAELLDAARSHWKR